MIASDVSGYYLKLEFWVTYLPGMNLSIWLNTTLANFLMFCTSRGWKLSIKSRKPMKNLGVRFQIDLILGCPLLPRSITNDHSSSQIKKFSSFPQKFQKKWKKRHSDQRGVRNSRIWGKEWENDMRKISPFSTIFSNFFWAQNLLLYYNCSFRYVPSFLVLRFLEKYLLLIKVIVMVSWKKLTKVQTIVLYISTWGNNSLLC